MLLRNISRGVIASARRYLSASVTSDNKFITIEQDDGKTMKFPGIWLRDNCQCPSCFHAETQSRLPNWGALNPKVKVKSVQIGSDSHAKSVKVQWNDEHGCDFDLKWLEERDFSLERRQKALDELYRPKTDLWSAKEFAGKFKRYDLEGILREDKVLYEWLQALAVWGIALIENAPADEKVSRKLAERIGYIKSTTYGDEFYVKSKPGAKNYAYLMTPLALHTDMPYFDYMPGINILHFHTQSRSVGGANTMCDGFYVARRLKWEHPKYYDILSSTLVDWTDIGAEGDYSFHNTFRAPVICLDLEGNLTRINQNTPRRDSIFRIDVDKVIPWYEAYAKFVELSRDETVEFKVQQGEVLTFNNLRMMHGRTAYQDTDDNHRCLVGAYVDWDIIYSKLRLLRDTVQS